MKQILSLLTLGSLFIKRIEFSVLFFSLLLTVSLLLITRTEIRILSLLSLSGCSCYAVHTMVLWCRIHVVVYIIKAATSAVDEIMYVISVKFLWFTFLDSGDEHSKLHANPAMHVPHAMHTPPPRCIGRLSCHAPPAMHAPPRPTVITYNVF